MFCLFRIDLIKRNVIWALHRVIENSHALSAVYGKGKRGRYNIVVCLRKIIKIFLERLLFTKYDIGLYALNPIRFVRTTFFITLSCQTVVSSTLDRDSSNEIPYTQNKPNS